MHATGPIPIASIQAASTANSIHRGQSSVKRASPTHGGRWLAQTNYDALITQPPYLLNSNAGNSYSYWIRALMFRSNRHVLRQSMASVVTSNINIEGAWGITAIMYCLTFRLTVAIGKIHIIDQDIPAIWLVHVSWRTWLEIISWHPIIYANHKSRYLNNRRWYIRVSKFHKNRRDLHMRTGFKWRAQPITTWVTNLFCGELSTAMIYIS